jgi:hypothetical protein
MFMLHAGAESQCHPWPPLLNINTPTVGNNSWQGEIASQSRQLKGVIRVKPDLTAKPGLQIKRKSPIKLHKSEHSDNP